MKTAAPERFNPQEFGGKTCRNTAPTLPLPLGGGGGSHQTQASSSGGGRERSAHGAGTRQETQGESTWRRLSFPTCSPQDWGKGLGLQMSRWSREKLSKEQGSLIPAFSCAEPRIWTICPRSPQQSSNILLCHKVGNKQQKRDKV